MSDRNYFDDLADRLDAINGVGVEYGIADEAHPSGMSAAELGRILYYGTKDGHIPARDYISDAVREVDMQSPVFFGRVLAAAYAGRSPLRHLEDLADVAQQALYSSMQNYFAVPNAKATIRRKGFNDPLIHYGDLLGAVTAEVMWNAGDNAVDAEVD